MSSAETLKIHWFTFTVRKDLNRSDIAQFSHNYLDSNIIDYQSFDTGRYFYKKRLTLYSGKEERINILFDGIEANKGTVCFEIRGSVFDSNDRPLDIDLTGIARYVLRAGGNLTRCDVALDDYDETGPGILPMNEIVHCSDVANYKDRIVGGFRSTPTYYKSTGESVYFGKDTKGRNRVRIYDKAAEQGLTGPHWIRTELILKNHDDTRLVLEALANGGDMGALARHILFKFIDFKEQEPASKDKYDRETCQWWLNFLGNIQKMKLGREKPRKKDRAEPVRQWKRLKYELETAFLKDKKGSKVKEIAELVATYQLQF